MDEEAKPRFLDPEVILEIIIRRRWLIIIPLLISGIAGLFLAFNLPKKYSATTLIVVQPQRVPTDYVQSIVTSGIEQRIGTLSQEILSRTNLEKIIQQFGLYSGPDQQDMFMEEKVAALENRIEVNVTRARGRRSEANAFSITYSGSEPERVSAIANTLASFFIDENLKIREAQAIGTSDFLQDELSAMKRRLEETEKALKDYRQSNMGELPEQLDSNLRILDRLQMELTAKEQSLRDARAQLMDLRNQTVPASSADGQQADFGSMSYDQLQAELKRLQARYTDKHPDIVRLKNLISESQPTQGGGPPAESQDIRETRSEIRVIQEDLADIRAQIAVYNRRVENAPQREQELLSLQRDYNNLQQSYQSLLNRKLEAELAVNMERKQKGEQFRVIDPARTPKKPVSPDLRKLFLLALAAGMGMGAGLCFLLEYTGQVFRRPDEIGAYLGLPVIATIPIITRRKDRVVSFLNNALTIAAGGAVCLTYAMFGVLILMGEKGLKGILRNALSLMNL